VNPNRRAEVPRKHLGTETNPQIGLVLGKRHLDPLDLVTDERVGIVDAHRTAEDDRARMHGQGIRQRIAEARTTDVHRNAAGLQVVADTAGCRQLLMQHDQYGPGHNAGNGVPEQTT